MSSKQRKAEFDTVKKRGPCSRNESFCAYKDSLEVLLWLKRESWLRLFYCVIWWSFIVGLFEVELFLLDIPTVARVSDISRWL